MTAKKRSAGAGRDAGAALNLTTVKIQRKKPGAYHHGDLRQAVLAASGKIVEERGLPALSLRTVAGELRVSHVAVYHHFPDREALVTALAIEAYARLRSAMAGAIDEATDARGALRRVGIAYVRFATTYPGAFRLIFSGELAASRTRSPLREAADDAFAVFRATVAAAMPESTDVDMAATAAWSLVHGMSVLLLDHQVSGWAPTPRNAERFAEAVLRHVRMSG